MLNEHPARRPLAQEIHARPPVPLKMPATVSHLAVITGEETGGRIKEHLLDLCRHFSVPGPGEGTTHFAHDFGPFILKWERHTEFSTYTFFQHGKNGVPFKETPLEDLPKDWIQGLPGQVIGACHIALRSADDPGANAPDIAAMFDNNQITGSLISGGVASLWTDYQIHADGFLRFLIRENGLSEASAGRAVQRIIELDTYRMMAMLAFPLAKENRPLVTHAENELSSIIAELATRHDVEDERELLSRLSALAAEAERISVALTYRFSAAKAYHALIKKRMANMREARIEGVPRALEFLDRRFAPAMETCENLASRLETLSGRINRATSLLRTRVDVALEAQNRDLLESMNRRARLQLRLQQTVEGLSIVAISYYVLSIVSYVAKAGEVAGWLPIDPYLVVGGAFPLVVGAVWMGGRRVKKIIEREKHLGDGEND